MALHPTRAEHMKTNRTRNLLTEKTHEGKSVLPSTPEAELVRTASSCLLFEGTFYESGEDIAERIHRLVLSVEPIFALRLAQSLRHDNGLRHAPLWILNSVLDHPGRHAYSKEIAAVIANVAGSRGDLPGELLAMYWKNGKRPLAKALRRGLADAIRSLSSYAMQKYAARGPIRLRDVMFMTHVKPQGPAQAEWFQLLAEDALPPADTWETRLSAGEDKRAAFASMLADGTLGSLAILRNVRNMTDVGISALTISGALSNAIDRQRFGIMPFQFLSAAIAAPLAAPYLEAPMMNAVHKYVDEHGKLSGHTLLMVDVSASTQSSLSERSNLMIWHAESALAVLLREACEDVSIFDYNFTYQQVPPYRGFALVEKIRGPGGGTLTNECTQRAYEDLIKKGQKVDRIIIVTDEQTSSWDTNLMHLPKGVNGYIMNIGPYKNGIARGKWTTVSGFSENLVKFILSEESLTNRGG